MSQVNYYSNYPITCNWTCHRNRGSLGGIDRAMPKGTPLRAPDAAVVTFIPNNGTGGHTATFTFADGRKTQYMHLSRFEGASGRSVSQGTVVGYSGGVPGDAGAGTSTGAHLHAHSIVGGVRVAPLHEGAPAGATGTTNWMGGGSAAAWAEIQRWLTKIGLYKGKIDGDPKQVTWTAYQTWLKQQGWYSGTVDGVPGILSWKGAQTHLKQQGLYSGDIDGVPGPLTAAAINALGTRLATPTIEPKQRKVGSTEVLRRVTPDRSQKEIAPALQPGEIGNFIGWAHGESVNGNDIWFQGTSKTWFWSGGFTDTGTHDLPEVVIVPPAVLDPAAPWKSQTPDVPDVKWIGSPNYNRWPAQTDKDHFTEHWMAGTLAGTDATFQLPGTIVSGRGTNAASNFGVGQTETHQYVLLKDYQHGDGDRASNTTGVSVEHEGGPDRPITDAVYARSAKLHADVMKTPNWKGGDKLIVGVNMFPHNHWVSTTCPGTLDLERLARETNALLHPEQDIDVAAINAALDQADAAIQTARVLLNKK